MEEIQNFVDYLRYQKRYSLLTCKSYQIDLLQLEEFLINLKVENLLDANPKQLRLFISNKKQEGEKNTSINRKISAIRSFYKYWHKQGALTINPANKLINLKEPERLPEFVNQENMDKLLDESQNFLDDDIGKRDRLIIELFYDTGLRQSELINLKLSDIDFSAKNIIVKGKGNKTRIIPLNNNLLEMIKDYVKNQKTYLFELSFGKPLYSKLVYRIVNNHLRELNVTRKCSPHVLRHSFATNMLNNGADLNAIKELLGHANLQATQVYTHVSFEKINKVYKQAHPRGE